MRKFKVRMNTKAKKALAVAVVLTTAGAFVSWPAPKASALLTYVGNGQALAIASVNAAAQFGDSVWRTHENGIYDPYSWGLTTFLPTVTYYHDGQTITLHLGYGNSTPVEYNGTMYFAVPANNEGASDNPTAPGYLIAMDVSPSGWKQDPQTGAFAPTVKWVQPVTGVSNSAPVIDKATGNVYLAAGDNLYGFQPDGTPIGQNGNNNGSNPFDSSGTSTDQHNMYSSDPID
ncbi:hypothetical protein [Alicyclobacillus acidocaldarius]|uniref:hypothetical protein n=1 Tax=Alicyclobacillus acidocaldarius TaxID=405212 RepID=UPI0002ECCBAB|nr:hypothetical protein [Alicyclobacillus acidocaldarius]